MEKENANDKFTRLATARVNKILKGYQLLANLSGSNYKSSVAERNEIIAALRAGLDELEVCFAGEKVDKQKFTFKATQQYSNGYDESEEEPLIQ